MKAPLSDLAVELRLEAAGLAESKLVNNIARAERCRSWAEQLEAADGACLEALEALAECFRGVDVMAFPAPALVLVALTKAKRALDGAHSRLDAALSRANQNPASCSADPSRPAPPDGAAMGLSCSEPQAQVGGGTGRATSSPGLSAEQRQLGRSLTEARSGSPVTSRLAHETGRKDGGCSCGSLATFLHDVACPLYGGGA